jgi:endonuclease-3
MAVLNKRSIEWALQVLRERYGERPAKRFGDGVSVLVGTILSQNTSNANSSAGYRQLRRRFASWDEVADAPTEEVERHIRVSGLSNIKAPRIQTILRAIRTERGRINLQFLADEPLPDAVRYLLKFPGVGMKTASCVLLFAFGRGVFPVDTHIHRIARRLGWVSDRASADDVQNAIEPLTPEPDRYALHVLLIDHGRATCRAISPKCGECALRRRCDTGRSALPTEANDDKPFRRGTIRTVIRTRRSARRSD